MGLGDEDNDVLIGVDLTRILVGGTHGERRRRENRRVWGGVSSLQL